MSKPIFTISQWSYLLTRLGVKPSTLGDWPVVFHKGLTTDSFSAGWRAELPDFLGQILHESTRLSRLEESLYYTTAARLCAVWPSRFRSEAFASAYVRNPRKLADYVYGNRLGNINGDGWTYRGSGLIMCTGLTNFRVIESCTRLPVCADPDMMRKPEGALSVALAWWEKKVPDSAMGDRRRVRRAVNGGEIGVADTIAVSNLAEEVINELVS